MAKLKFYYSTMFAGKTTDCIKTYDIYKRKGLNPIVIKPSIDNREGDFFGWGTTQSRITKEKIPAFYFTDLEFELIDTGILLQHNAILVDEAQFLTKSNVLRLSEQVDRLNKDVICYGLKTDVNGNLFPGAAALLALADESKEIDNICQMDNCTNKAQLHLRFIDGKVDKSGKSVAIEKGSITYKAVCRKCWNRER